MTGWGIWGPVLSPQGSTVSSLSQVQWSLFYPPGHSILDQGPATVACRPNPFYLLFLYSPWVGWVLMWHGERCKPLWTSATSIFCVIPTPWSQWLIKSRRRHSLLELGEEWKTSVARISLTLESLLSAHCILLILKTSKKKKKNYFHPRSQLISTLKHRIWLFLSLS